MNHKEETPLSEWLSVPGNNPSVLARLTKFSQSGVRKMSLSDRAIFVVEDIDGIRLFEYKELVSPKDRLSLFSGIS
ncbi:hypothetical protein [Agarilytica rhodophyticola]|uniref:hypothetical protein n=1 Tax=Agarilytica rhodophyticola TaxID=1737490 RepID=UPI000B3422B7|nr:hypothetical protein [Agarilytica rhodophyticola]